MYDVHLQVQQTLDLLLPDARARGLEWDDITQSLYELERAIADFGNTPEVTLIGDSINNAQVLLLLNNALPDALHEIKQHLDRSHPARTEVTHECARVAPHAYFEVFESFAFGCRSATALINKLVAFPASPTVKVINTRIVCAKSLRTLGGSPRRHGIERTKRNGAYARSSPTRLYGRLRHNRCASSLHSSLSMYLGRNMGSGLLEQYSCRKWRPVGKKLAMEAYLRVTKLSAIFGTLFSGLPSLRPSFVVSRTANVPP
jgi:hypothetical protein